MPDVREATAKEIVRLSELYLDGTLRLSLGADARAMQLSGILGALATALVVAGIGALLGNNLSLIDRNRWALAASLMAPATFFMAALAYSLNAAAPRGFYVAGNYFSSWSSDEDLYGPLATALIEQARVYEEQINENTDNLERRASSIKVALRFMWLAPIAAIVAGGAAYAAFDHLAQFADWIKALR
jgi:hypothetical protein